VLGAGLDAVPLADIADRLGWRVTVADHRPASLARGDFPAGTELVETAPAAVARALRLERYAAVVVMSHHLDSDRAYLRALADAPAPYLGLLGPAARRERLLADLGEAGLRLRGRLHGPVGLPIRADSPETIALAILAEIHAALAGRVDLVAGSRAR
jgi:xanthine/CO dehydrogenase XdhC/CoxF family maturation factor